MVDNSNTIYGLVTNRSGKSRLSLRHVRQIQNSNLSGGMNDDSQNLSDR